MTSDLSSLGTSLRQLLERLDRDVDRAYRERGLDFRPRYTSIVRLLIDIDALRVGEIVARLRVTQPSVSATLAAMQRDGLIESAKGQDGRERLITLTPKGRDMLPVLQKQWQATAVAAHSLNEDLGLNLEELVCRALEHLETRSFQERMSDTADADVE